MGAVRIAGTGAAGMPRVLLLLFVLCLTTMMFISRCGLPPPHDGDRYVGGGGRRALESIPASQDCGSQLLDSQRQLEQQEEKYTQQVESLKQQIRNLESQLVEARQMMSELAGKLQTPADAGLYKNQALRFQQHVDTSLHQAEITAGNPHNNEYEVFPFCRFTMTRIYLVDPGLGKRVVEKPIGLKKKEIVEVVGLVVEQLNEDRDRAMVQYSADDFLEGIYRTEPTLGTHYELYFRDVEQPASLTYRKMTLTRPFAPLQTMLSEMVSTKRQIINLILPLKGRIDKFQAFMSQFERICIRHDKRVFLTVVYFGLEGLEQVKSIISKTSKKYRFKSIKLVTLNEAFSRGRGLQVGAQSWTQGDVIMFLCDVDIVFSTDFLERCRVNTKKGEKVYYPIVFSLYNPTVVYALQDAEIPPQTEQLVISKDTGFWRDFGYGMTCQYRSDFLKVKGFDVQITGWGEEDVYLYRKYVKSEYFVVRATDPAIFHLWHEKFCDPALPSDQYRGCIRSKALNEASHSQLGMLAFKDEIDIHRSLKTKDSRRRR